MSEILHKDLSYKINGILFEIHNKLGSFCNHNQYFEALEIVLKNRGMSYQREIEVPIMLDGHAIGGNRLDFLIDDKIVLDVKNKKIITKKDYVQMKRYLNAAQKELGMIVNFAEKSIKPARIINKIN